MSATKSTFAKNVLILGATSGIARALAHELGRRNRNLILAGRDADELERIAADVRIRHNVQVQIEPFDALDYESHADFFARCESTFEGGLNGVFLCHGFLAPQEEAQGDFAVARAIIDLNYTSAVSILNVAANYFEARGRGYICGISSVAGERGRQSNYIYGSAKAGFTTYLQGLRSRLAKAGVVVVTVKPGFVDTAMTFGLPNVMLAANPQRVAQDICRGISKRRDVIYTPWFWQEIMTVIKAIPEPIFKKLSI